MYIKGKLDAIPLWFGCHQKREVMVKILQIYILKEHLKSSKILVLLSCKLLFDLDVEEIWRLKSMTLSDTVTSDTFSNL